MKAISGTALAIGLPI